MLTLSLRERIVKQVQHISMLTFSYEHKTQGEGVPVSDFHAITIVAKNITVSSISW